MKIGDRVQIVKPMLDSELKYKGKIGHIKKVYISEDDKMYVVSGTRPFWVEKELIKLPNKRTWL